MLTLAPWRSSSVAANKNNDKLCKLIEINYNDDDTPIFDVSPQDLRPYFISRENLKLMTAIMRFAADYVRGVYKLNNLALMNCENLKHTNECMLSNVSCDKCKNEFRKMLKPDLYCLIYKKNIIENECNTYNKYKLVCGQCAKDVLNVAAKTSKTENVSLFQLYPIVTLNTVEELCRYNFVTKYLFKINVDDYVVNKQVFQDKTLNVYKSFCDITRNKSNNEQIVSIKLLTYEKTLLVENSDYCFMTHENGKNVLQFKQSSCNMVEFAKRHCFEALTYFYEVEKRVYANQNYDYTVYFSKPFSGYNKRLYCSKCKSKFYKNNIIMYCGRCGFINRMHFNAKIDKVDLNKMIYYADCVRAKRNKYNCLIYYDMDMYNNKILNANVPVN
ncbi:Me53 [Artaxa digramma nucleopolyhedrovirus]|uniref:Me53 n=1 Tax=Artaxa digramma nucleopolyhedrovirus TaxID=3070910 RepID=A0AAE6R6T4_9ABAC|nr:Me53 [Euproctis digramma nucleopolyhedrovirus]QHB21674.1 Me53 [Artaxa digramma nucleopolyhedrovirus]